MRRAPLQIRCSSDVSIAGRIDRLLQVISGLLPRLSLFNSVHVILLSLSHGRLKLYPNTSLGVFSPLSQHAVKALMKRLLTLSCLFSDTGSSSSEDEGPKRPTAGPVARNGDIRRRRSRTPSPRRRHRDGSPRLVLFVSESLDVMCHQILTYVISPSLPPGKDVLHLLDADGAHRLPHDAADLRLPLEEGMTWFI